MQKGQKTPRDHLIAAARSSNVTLVLGAGISRGSGLPGWLGLVESLWARHFPGVALPGAESVPLRLQIALELVARKVGDPRFARALRDELYARVKPPTPRLVRASKASLYAIARAIVAQHSLGQRGRIARIISFNVDDMVELAVNALDDDEVVLKPVARASQHPRWADGVIPIYHLHGFLPHDPKASWHEHAPDTLVFSDAQYWATLASPSSYANRVMSFALHDSHCVFIGMSMTDMNLARWLAVHAGEVEADKVRQFRTRPRVRGRADGPARAVRQALLRHFWLRADSDDPSGFLGQWLAVRGVRAVDIGSWDGPHLSALLNDAFACAPVDPEA